MSDETTDYDDLPDLLKIIASFRAHMAAMDMTLGLMIGSIDAEMKDRLIHQMNEEAKNKCPKCESDNLSDITTMGQHKTQYECVNCYHRFE